VTDILDLVLHTAELAAAHLEELDSRPVFPELSSQELRLRIEEKLPEEPVDPHTVIDELAAAVGPGLVDSPGRRYFGGVTGGAVPAALAADWLVSAWDQNGEPTSAVRRRP
jgi:hypothetical protein